MERATEREDRLPRDRARREGRGRGGGWGGMGVVEKTEVEKMELEEELSLEAVFFLGYVLGVASFFGLHK